MPRYPRVACCVGDVEAMRSAGRTSVSGRRGSRTFAQSGVLRCENAIHREGHRSLPSRRSPVSSLALARCAWRDGARHGGNANNA
jgi:hypothetical protein